LDRGGQVKRLNKGSLGILGALLLSGMAMTAVGQQVKPKVDGPWMDTKLSPEKRAELVLKELTLDEKIGLLHGEGMPDWPGMPPAIQAVQSMGNGGAGFVLGVPRLGIPVIQMTDAAYGVRNSGDNGRYSTALPSNLGSAASWDLNGACRYGALIGSEMRAQGYNMTLGGGVNLTREPRNGRTFEYMGEDPLLAGLMVGSRIKCEGEQKVISDIKHYAFNDQESGRNSVDVTLGERAGRESDLLAFELGVREGDPKAVMCSYNGLNGNYACENKYLLTDVLKKDFGFKGFVVSDWGGTHSTEKASAAGLDQEQPLDTFYGAKLKEAVEAGRVPQAELDEHVRRVLYAEFASGIVDAPKVKSVPDVEAGLKTAREIEQESIVLLKNAKATLPLAKTLKSVAVIGKKADYGTLSGGGSAQVDPPGEAGGHFWRREVWFPGSPVDALKAKAVGATVTYTSGEDIAAAVKAAKAAEVAVVFASQWEAEDADLPNLSLPGNQDALIAAVSAANPHTVVVLETGTAVTMPWLGSTAAVLEAWYPGSRGELAIANVLFGDVNPSGKLPMTFPMSEADLPRATVAMPPKSLKPGDLSAGKGLTFGVDYNVEGAAVGYKWYESQKKPVLFPFGFGLSYTSFAYSGLKVAGGSVTFTVKNTGLRDGTEIAEVYAKLPASAGEPWKRLAGWQRVDLAAGESRTVTIKTEPLTLKVWDETAHHWMSPEGKVEVMVGPSSAELPLTGNQ
jgi:beta-glucosidase